MQTVDDARNAGESALKQARRAAKQGDLAACEKWSKNAERMALAAEKLAALPQPEDSYENEEALRAELRERLARYAEAAQENRRWKNECEAHAQATAAALAAGREPPPPLDPAPHDLDAIARGGAPAAAGSDASATA